MFYRKVAPNLQNIVRIFYKTFLDKFGFKPVKSIWGKVVSLTISHDILDILAAVASNSNVQKRVISHIYGVRLSSIITISLHCVYIRYIQ